MTLKAVFFCMRDQSHAFMLSKLVNDDDFLTDILIFILVFKVCPGGCIDGPDGRYGI